MRHRRRNDELAYKGKRRTDVMLPVPSDTVAPVIAHPRGAQLTARPVGGRARVVIERAGQPFTAPTRRHRALERVSAAIVVVGRRMALAPRERPGPV